MRTVACLFFICFLNLSGNAQDFVTRSIKDFGAKGNGRTNDHEAFVKASAFFNNRKGHGKLIIPKGIYIVGKQRFTGNDANKKGISYTGDYVIDLRNCDDLVIEGKPGAILKHRDSLRLGTFIPGTGESFKHQIKDIQVRHEYYRYQSNAGSILFVLNCSNVRVSGLTLNGNFDHFIFGGNWGIGRNAYELNHYGIHIMDAHDISIKKCLIQNFASDGIYIANVSKGLSTYKISIDHCKVNYSGRNGLSWIGGEDIRVTNSEFSNSGQGLVQESPSAGISIEAENSSTCRKGYFYNCSMLNNVGSGITSGSQALASDVLFKKCTAASPVYYAVFADAASHRFEDCRFYGTVLVWYDAVSENDAVKFKRCIFEENYNGKKMYDGNYQLGVEGSGVEIDSCLFRAYTTSSYYLSGHVKDCSRENRQKIRVLNSTFINYCRSGFKLSESVAGIAGFTVFYNNSFYTQPGVTFTNRFNDNCNADAGRNNFYPVNRSTK